MRYYDRPHPELINDYLSEGRFHDKPEIPNSPEACEALKIAEGKLVSLIDTQKFCYRFMSIDEYRDIMRNKEYGGEVIVNAPTGSSYQGELPPTFREFAALKKGGVFGEADVNIWARKAAGKTDWSTSTEAIKHANSRIGYYNELRTDTTLQEAKDRNMSKSALVNEKYRNSLLECMAELKDWEKEHGESNAQFQWPKIAEVASTWTDKEQELTRLKEEIIQAYGVGSESIIDFAKKRAKEMADKNEPFSKLNNYSRPKFIKTEEDLAIYVNLVEPYEKILYLQYFFGRENIVRLGEFLRDPQSVPIRDIFNILTYVQRARQGEAWKQYNVIMVFSEDALQYGINESSWSMVTSEQPSRAHRNNDPGNDVLAIIALLPNKEIVHELIATSLDGGSFAHAILDHNGKIEFPQKKRFFKSKSS